MNGNGRPLTDCNSMAPQSVRVITNRDGEEEVIVSQWKLRNDAVLELPAPVPGANYVLEVCSSDGNRVRIPIGVPTCGSEVPQSSPEQS